MYNFYFISNNIIESDNRNLGFLPQSRGCRSKSVLFVIPSFLLQLHKYWICTFRFWTKDLNLVPCAACMFCYPNYIRLYFASRNAYYTLHSQSYTYQVLQTLTLYCGTLNWLCVQKMLNHGLNHGFLLIKLISCPIHWIVCVLAYLNLIFKF